MTASQSQRSMSDIFEHVGAIAATWSIAELNVQIIIWKLLGVDEETGLCVTTHVDHNLRCDIANSLAERALTPEDAQRLKGLLNRSKGELKTERNTVIHSVWTLTDADGARATKWTARGSLKAVQNPYSTTKLLRIAQDIARLADELEAFADSLPPPAQPEPDRQS